MTPKKLLIRIAVLLLLCVVGFCGLLYYTLRTKVQDVTQEAPFSNFVAKKMKLGNDAILIHNYEHFVYEEPLLLDAVGSQLYDGTTIAYYLKTGDAIEINSAKNFTNGTSGITHTILFGNVTTGTPRVLLPFEYYWETQKIEKDTQGVFVFQFEVADWENEL